MTPPTSPSPSPSIQFRLIQDHEMYAFHIQRRDKQRGLLRRLFNLPAVWSRWYNTGIGASNENQAKQELRRMRQTAGQLFTVITVDEG